MSKSNGKSKATKMTLNFTVKATSERGGGKSCHYNEKLRRLSIPASKCEGVKQYEVSGIEGKDALCLTPSEEGRAVHPSQHFITVPASIADGMKSTDYTIADGDELAEYEMAEGTLVLLGKDVKLADLAVAVDENADADADGGDADEKADETPTPTK